MDQEDITRKSKFLSFVLRHHPEAIGLELDRRGWAYLPELISKARQEGKDLTREELERIIDYSDKKRFEISDDGEYIRAGYGHSIDLDMGLDPVEPPGTLYHGTAERNVSPIMEKGLDPQNRNYVHLSADRSSAREVGMRHGKPVIVSVDAGRMHEEGHAFYRSESEPGIWLTEEVPPEYVSVR